MRDDDGRAGPAGHHRSSDLDRRQQVPQPSAAVPVRTDRSPPGRTNGTIKPKLCAIQLFVVDIRLGDKSRELGRKDLVPSALQFVIKICQAFLGGAESEMETIHIREIRARRCE